MLAQAAFDDLGLPLSDVTFCVLDLETTGGSPGSDAITEVGAVKVRRGESLGTFHTLVAPGAPIPTFIRLLTGISDEMLSGAPPIETVLPSLLEFFRGAVLVAHNAPFDIGFVNHALAARGYPPLDNRVLDTAALARKILMGEVPNRKLETLARHLRCPHHPCHRALADALATVDVLHHLIERATGYGATTIEDLVSLSGTRIDGTFTKIRMTEHLPRGIGVYRFLGPASETLYVGKASDVRSRVRSYFYGDPRRGIRDLLRETQDIVAECHVTTLEAEVAEARAIQRESPRFNRAGKRRAAWYIRVTRVSKATKVCLTRKPKESGVYLGPFSSRTARELLSGLREGLAIHRCARPERCRGCAFSELRSCAGTDARAHRAEVRAAALAMAGDPSLLFDRLSRRMKEASARGCFERAAQVRERAESLERALEREADVRALIAGGDVVLALGRRALLVRDAQLAAAADLDPDREASCTAGLKDAARARPVGAHIPADVAAEAQVIARWVARHAGELRLVSVEGSWARSIASRPSGRFRVREPVAATS